MINIPIQNVSWSSDEAANSKPTSPPSFSMSATISMTKSQRKRLRELCRTRPDLKHPTRKRSFRLIRKWFNRYQKPKLIGTTIQAETANGEHIPMIITNVTISKGITGPEYQFTAKPS